LFRRSASAKRINGEVLTTKREAMAGIVRLGSVHVLIKLPGATVVVQMEDIDSFSLPIPRRRLDAGHQARQRPQ
jgi:hypothetical protein